jgi:hypothetical protein
LAALTLAGVAAARGWPRNRTIVAMNQLLLNEEGLNAGAVDGLMGPNTRYALEQWQDRLRDLPSTGEDAGLPETWPRQAGVERFYGPPGSNLVKIECPYQLYLAWATSTPLRKWDIHERVADSALRVMGRVLSHYGAERIHGLKLDLWAGCAVIRPMRGGTKLSMHSYGIAIDWNSEFNQLRWGRDKATLAQPEYETFWKLWEEEGWLSLGRARNYDWMHVQAARL